MSLFNIKTSIISPALKDSIAPIVAKRPSYWPIRGFMGGTSLFKVQSRAINNDIRGKNRITHNNDSSKTTTTKTATAIRENKYRYNFGQFVAGYPESETKVYCPQKVSTVFLKNNHYSTSYIIKNPAFKTTNISLVKNRQNLQATAECSCFYADLSGEYILDWTINSNQLISSDNALVNNGTINFDLINSYIDIELYSNISNSKIHIRLRPPLKYRAAYDDWTFDEDVTIEELLSNTEYAEVINCCGQTTAVLM